MKQVLLITIVMGAVVFHSSLVAQDDDSTVILPVEAQSCDLPSAPASIPENPTREQLLGAKSDMTDFQGLLMTYRECLDNSGSGEELTDGNTMAINEAYNYSVEMEERVAMQFNEAVCYFKAADDAAATATCDERFK